MLQDRTGDWWIGTNKGLFRFANLTTIDDVSRSSPSAIYTTRDGLAGPQVLRLFEDSRGDVWIGTVGGAGLVGLSRWQRKTSTLRHFTDGMASRRSTEGYVLSFAEDRAGHVWIGFSGLGGLARYQDERFVRFTSADGVPAGRISNLLLDSKGRIWAATDRAGLSRSTLPRRTVPRLSRTPRRRACPATNARAVVEDRPGGASTSATGRGIDRMDPASGRIQHYRAPRGSRPPPMRRCAMVTARCGLPRPPASCAWCPRSIRCSARRRFSSPLSPSGAVRARSPRLASRTCACSSRRRVTPTSRSISSRSDSATVKSCGISTRWKARRTPGAGPPPGAR